MSKENNLSLNDCTVINYDQVLEGATTFSIRSFVMLSAKMLNVINAEIFVSNSMLSAVILNREPFCTVDLLELTSLDKLIFKLKILINFITKHFTIMRRSIVLSLPFQLMFPAHFATWIMLGLMIRMFLYNIYGSLLLCLVCCTSGDKQFAPKSLAAQ